MGEGPAHGSQDKTTEGLAKVVEDMTAMMNQQR